MATANCTVAIYRDTETDGYGDEVDDNTTAVATAVPASIREQTRRVWNRATATPRVVRSATGRVAAGTDIRDADRLTNEQTEATYLVDAVGTPPDAGPGADLVLELRCTT